jgi:nucleotidyltransferase substrate binding protein (TIGR01987 family)
VSQDVEVQVFSAAPFIFELLRNSSKERIMISPPDIRWKQRLKNFQQAFKQLEAAVSLFNSRQLSDLEKQGLIQAFEFTHELAWTTLKDYFEYQGNPSITGSRDAAREAFQKGLIQNGDPWMEMIKSRNQTSHTYNEGVATEIIDRITSQYFKEFQHLLAKLIEISAK